MTRDQALMRARSIHRDRLFGGDAGEIINVRRTKKATGGEFQVLQYTAPVRGLGRICEIVASGDSWDEVLERYEHRRCGLTLQILDQEATDLRAILTGLADGEKTPRITKLLKRVGEICDAFDQAYERKPS